MHGINLKGHAFYFGIELLPCAVVIELEGDGIVILAIHGQEQQITVHLVEVSQHLAASALRSTESTHFQRGIALLCTINFDDTDDRHVVGVEIGIAIPMLFRLGSSPDIAMEGHRHENC